MLSAADPDADLEFSLAEWRRYRRRKRLADVHWIDAMYQAYLTALLSTIAIWTLAGFVGDDPLTGGQLARALAEGSDWLGAVAATALAVGLRSGSRGGPLALERAEVRHVLLAPVDRTSALLAPVVRQLRFVLFASVLVGLVLGNLAARRLDGSEPAWMAAGALFCVTCVVLAYGAALCASAWRLPSWAGTLGGVILVGIALADGLDVVDGSPMTAWGRIGMWADGFSWVSLVAIGVSAAVLAVGLSRVGDVSVEAAERRSTLVGQLRFAATLQDLRTVMVLRRQLAMELPRVRPWVQLRVHGTGRLPVWTRGLRGVLRWPAARVGRLLLLAVIAGFALRGVWEGTTPLVVVAGFALFLAALDALEPLAQEIDHPSRADSMPVDRGGLYLRHLPVAILVMTLVSAIGAVTAVIVDPTLGAVEVGAVCVIPAALGAVAGALASVIGGAPASAGGDSWSLMPPEVAGIRLVIRTVFPPAVAIAGTLPVLAARVATENEQPAPTAAAAAGVGVLVLFALIAGWVRMRDEIHAWWKASLEQAMPTKRTDAAEQGEEAQAEETAGAK